MIKIYMNTIPTNHKIVSSKVIIRLSQEIDELQNKLEQT